jgi:hypothetical protein
MIKQKRRNELNKVLFYKKIPLKNPTGKTLNYPLRDDKKLFKKKSITKIGYAFVF